MESGTQTQMNLELEMEKTMVRMVATSAVVKKQKMMKEPPMGSIVVDISGSAWQRHPVGWCVSGGDGSWNYTWKELLKELYLGMTDGGPTPEWAPVLGDSRLPCIVYVPHEELLIEESTEDEC